MDLTTDAFMKGDLRMKKIRRYLSTILITCLIMTVQTTAFGETVDAKDFSGINSGITVESNGGKQKIVETGQMKLEERSIKQNNTLGKTTTYSESYSTVVCIDEEGHVEILDELDIPTQYSTRSSSGNSESNVYWKAYVNINYTVSGSFAKLISVNGSWVQLRGTSTLSGRKVFYNQTPNGGRPVTKYPTSNSFSYATGFSLGKVASMGCNSTVTVNHSSGLSTTLKANVSWSP